MRARTTDPEGTAQRGVLYISNVGKGCRYLTSEFQRLEGFRRYLPAQGWTLTALVKDCNCVSEAGTGSGEFTLAADAGSDDPMWREEVASQLREGGREGCIFRLPCAPRWWYRWWIRAAERTTWGFASPADSAEVLNFVKPLPELAGRIAGARTPWQELAVLPVKVAGRWVIHQDEQDRIDWLDRAPRVGKFVAEQGGARLIVGSFPGIQNLEVAAEVSRRTGLPWIADFRDSARGGWCYGPEIIPRVRRAVRSASAFLYANAALAEDDADLRDGKPFTVVQNGYLDEELERATAAAREASPTEFTIRFLGTLYPTRNLDLFLAGFKLALQQAGASDLRFEFFGPSARNVRAVCEKLDLLPHCAAHDPVGHEEALMLTAAATALVLPTNTVGHHGMGGAKLYEYLGVRRPILAAGGPDRLVEGVVAATRTGACCHSPEAVARVLLDWYGQWRDTGRLELDVNEAEIRKHSRRGSAEVLAGVLNSVNK